jgi:D-beta-D-heptose 7-phosphate kinase/D-beta-D-heptose 1-phosphate adenosyltransferase
MDDYFKLPGNNKQIFIVVGDIMLDKITIGSIKGIANEAPIPVFKEGADEKLLLGGCGNVAANLAALGGYIHLVAAVGADKNADHIRSLLRRHGMATDGLCVDASRPTTCKHRYYIKNTLMFRSDNESVVPVSRIIELEIMQNIANIIESCKESSGCATIKIILSDYNKGVLTSTLKKYIISYAASEGVDTFVDPKAPLFEYRGCTFIKPNKTETLRLGGIDVNKDGIANAHIKIYEQTDCKASLITLAEDGMSLGFSDGVEHLEDKHIEALEVIDVTGAGDVVLAVVAFLWNTIFDYPTILQIANEFGRQAVMHCGTYVIKSADIATVFKNIEQRSCLQNNKVVFTNGCFDILHVGHLRLLEAASKLGNTMTVGINSDASVRRLKGATRPIRSEKDRAAMLLALPWVTDVRIFDEDTPASLIEQLKPDVLVKGGDYKLEDIVGREHAGSVVIFPFQEGSSNSSSKIIQSVLSNHK